MSENHIPNFSDARRNEEYFVFSEDGKTIVDYRGFERLIAVVPDGVTAIGPRAFWGISNLRRVVIPEGVTSVGSAAFECCFSLTSVVIPESMASIGDRAFGDCEKLSIVIIPENVEKICTNAFEGAGCENQVKRDYPHLFKEQ